VDRGNKEGMEDRLEPLIEENGQDCEIEGAIALQGQNMLGS
jgi:hypothetical protein